MFMRVVYVPPSARRQNVVSYADVFLCVVLRAIAYRIRLRVV
jgi:hypothetical protein